jgi:hypothetical protein
VFKREHVRRAVELLPRIGRLKGPGMFLQLAREVNAFATLNYSKSKRISAADVEQHLRSMGVLCPRNDFLARNSEEMASSWSIPSTSRTPAEAITRQPLEIG